MTKRQEPPHSEAPSLWIPEAGGNTSFYAVVGCPEQLARDCVRQDAGWDGLIRQGSSYVLIQLHWECWAICVLVQGKWCQIQNLKVKWNGSLWGKSNVTRKAKKMPFEKWFNAFKLVPFSKKLFRSDPSTDHSLNPMILLQCGERKW